MKATATLLLSLIAFTALAQMPISDETSLYTYQDVVETPGISSKDLYVRANSWFATRYNSAQNVIQYNDKEEGKIIGKGAFTLLYSMAERMVNYTITIEVKEGRYRYTISQFSLDWLTNPTVQSFESLPAMNKKKILPKTDEHIRALIEDLTEAMKTNKKDDW